MTFNRASWTRLAALAGGILLLAGCGGDDEGGNTTGPQPTPAPMAVTVTTATAPPPVFVPASIRVAVGGTVTWRNTSPPGAHHNVTGTGFSSADFLPGEQFQRVFPVAGTYTYRCTVHDGMVGSIIVQ